MLAEPSQLAVHASSPQCMSALRQLSAAQSSWHVLFAQSITAFAQALRPSHVITHGQSFGQSKFAPLHALSPLHTIAHTPSVQSSHAAGHMPAPGSTRPHSPMPVSSLLLPLPVLPPLL